MWRSLFGAFVLLAACSGGSGANTPDTGVMVDTFRPDTAPPPDTTTGMDSQAQPDTFVPEAPLVDTAPRDTAPGEPPMDSTPPVDTAPPEDTVATPDTAPPTDTAPDGPPGCSEAAPCPAGQGCCAGRCLDLQRDVNNCGACGNACPSVASTPSCVAGRCVCGCSASFGDCDGTCANGCEVNLATSAAHCGACGRACVVARGTPRCVGSVCQVAACDEGFGDCDMLAANGCEGDLRADNARCGACATRCGPGERCAAGRCERDCRRVGAVACEAGSVCDFTDGQCRAPGALCLLAGEFRACGMQSCGPGTTCDPESNRCVAFTGCRGLSCDASGRCYGTDCPCRRPAGTCSTASLEALNRADFLGSGSEGAFGFDLDDACNAYIATLVSGPDFVRRLAPSGALTVWRSVTNLNMGEVAVQRRPEGAYGGAATSEVAFAYICCSSCGCESTNPQGVGHVDMASSTAPLPVVIPATTTAGMGPFGVYYADTGPYGLAVSAAADFYVGNVRANGDYFRYDTSARSVRPIATLPARVHASTAYDLQQMLVAVEGGDLYLVSNTGGDPPRRLGSPRPLGSEVVSVRRDPFTGRFYAGLRDRRLVSFAPDATDVQLVAMLPSPGRISLSADGWIYVLNVFRGSRFSEVTRYPLPATR
ncbi:MAG: hypothetical protein HY909_20795 [Deltaproteobacteria bacterium]|nr:hypothetical protein [Deltaproteobacteria bacterium]